MTKHKAGRLEHWEPVTIYARDKDCTVGQKVRGYVYDDERWEDGTLIYTSFVNEILPDENKLETANSIYVLGKKRDAD